MDNSWIYVSSWHSNHANLCIVQILLYVLPKLFHHLADAGKKQTNKKQPTIVFLGSVPPHDDKMKFSEGKKSQNKHKVLPVYICSFVDHHL